MSNGQFTWQAPFILRDPPGLPWRTGRHEKERPGQGGRRIGRGSPLPLFSFFVSFVYSVVTSLFLGRGVANSTPETLNQKGPGPQSERWASLGRNSIVSTS